MKEPSCKLETKCGWTGVLKSAISINSLWDRDDGNQNGTHKINIESSSKDSASQTTCSSSVSSVALHNSRSSQDESEPSKDFPSLSDVSLHWMGGEPSKYDHKLEQQGVSSILKALTDAERDEIIAFDMTVPIRHLRAEKVCFKFHVFKLF